MTDCNGLVIYTGRAYLFCCARNQGKIGNGLMLQEVQGFITVIASTHTAYAGISFFQFILLEATEFQLMIIIVVEPYFQGRGILETGSTRRSSEKPSSQNSKSGDKYKGFFHAAPPKGKNRKANLLTTMAISYRIHLNN